VRVIPDITDYGCERGKRLTTFVVLIDRRCSRRYVQNNSRPLSDVTNLLSSKTHADSTIKRDNRSSTLASMTRIRHTFNFCKNSVTCGKRPAWRKSRHEVRRSIEESTTAFAMHGKLLSTAILTFRPGRDYFSTQFHSIPINNARLCHTELTLISPEYNRTFA